MFIFLNKYFLIKNALKAKFKWDHYLISTVVILKTNVKAKLKIVMYLKPSFISFSQNVFKLKSTKRARDLC